MNIDLNLRTRLRADTRQEHERVDAAYKDVDLSAPEGLSAFLADHYSAFAALTIADRPGAGEARALLDEYLGALGDDLAALDQPLPPAAASLTVSPDAALYILLGSRRGAKLTQRYWAANARGAARKAGRFLSLDSRDSEWRALCMALSQRPADGPEADRATADVNAIFGLFAQAIVVKEYNE
ncbi:MAG: hypothetical protein Q4F71_11775 [Paracoccus sp. (in: a-proteobacteria)]|nr:hypothetical protein [Paracoccus sp. (in: a-proteobacteria)]